MKRKKRTDVVGGSKVANRGSKVEKKDEEGMEITGKDKKTKNAFAVE